VGLRGFAPGSSTLPFSAALESLLAWSCNGKPTLVFTRGAQYLRAISGCSPWIDSVSYSQTWSCSPSTPACHVLWKQNDQKAVPSEPEAYSIGALMVYMQNSFKLYPPPKPSPTAPPPALYKKTRCHS